MKVVRFKPCYCSIFVVDEILKITAFLAIKPPFSALSKKLTIQMREVLDKTTFIFIYCTYFKVLFLRTRTRVRRKIEIDLKSAWNKNRIRFIILFHMALHNIYYYYWVFQKCSARDKAKCVFLKGYPQ